MTILARHYLVLTSMSRPDFPIDPRKGARAWWKNGTYDSRSMLWHQWQELRKGGGGRQ
jgi:hypothetical protein